MKVKLILLGNLVFATQIESFCTISVKKEKHFGKVFSIMGNYEGNIYINLMGENHEMIEIDLGTVNEKSKGKKSSVSNGVNLNAKAIRSLMIDVVEYVIKDIEYEISKLYKTVVW